MRACMKCPFRDIRTHPDYLAPIFLLQYGSYTCLLIWCDLAASAGMLLAVLHYLPTTLLCGFYEGSIHWICQLRVSPIIKVAILALCKTSAQLLVCILWECFRYTPKKVPTLEKSCMKS